MWYKTQTEYDEIVAAMVTFEVNLANKVSMLRRQNDPDAFRREEELMALQNVLFSLAHYDIDSEILTDSEIEWFYELGTTIIQNCSI